MRHGPRRRCDHNSAAPRLFPTCTLAPNAPEKCKDLMAELGALFDRAGLFPELVAADLPPAWAAQIKRRSERREAWCLVGRALFTRFDLRTHRFGRPRYDARDWCDPPSRAELAEETGLNLSRVKRALADFEACGYVKSFRVVMEYVDGNRFCGLPSVRWATPLFLRRLGLVDEAAELEAKKARARYEAKRACRPSTARARQHATQAKRRLLSAGQRDGYRAPTPPVRPKVTVTKNFEWNQAARLERMRIRSEHPDWGPDQVDAEALRNLPPPPAR